MAQPLELVYDKVEISLLLEETIRNGARSLLPITRDRDALTRVGGDLLNNGCNLTATQAPQPIALSLISSCFLTPSTISPFPPLLVVFHHLVVVWHHAWRHLNTHPADSSAVREYFILC